MLEEYDDILSSQVVSYILGIGKNVTLRLLQNGEIPAKKVGNQWRILKSDLIVYLQTPSNRWETTLRKIKNYNDIL